MARKTLANAHRWRNQIFGGCGAGTMKVDRCGGEWGLMRGRGDRISGHAGKGMSEFRGSEFSN